MEIQIAVAKTNKYAVSESGDTLEVVERPGGGLSVVLADGQSSGRGAKIISMMVVRRVIGLLSEGVRDGAAARAASDYLFAERNGKVSSTLNIMSVDLSSETVVLARNNEAPIFVARGEEIESIDEPSCSIGTARNIKPIITEIPIQKGLTIVIYTDGLTHAGERKGQPMDVGTTLLGLLEDNDPAPQMLADALLAQAMRLDDNRPSDDISVAVLRVMPRTSDNVRRMSVRIPIEIKMNDQ
ncbi:MAG: PP2C family protein-serine/threonine phosphatase [Chloroflexota bacterium]